MKYTENHRLGEVISDNYKLLLVISRFGISCGFGDKSIKSICQERNVDCDTFLAVINYTANGDTCGINNISTKAMTDFLRSSHRYYIDFCFPQMKHKLEEAIDSKNNKVAELIINFFDKYVAEVSKHLLHEEKKVFPYVENLNNGILPEEPLTMTRYNRKHEQIDNMLSELKNIIIKYYPDNGKANALNSALYDLFSCEEDLKSHCEIEDNLYIPAVMALEKSVKGGK